MGALPPLQTSTSAFGQLCRALGSGISSELAHADSRVAVIATNRMPARISLRLIIGQLYAQERNLTSDFRDCENFVTVDAQPLNDFDCFFQADAREAMMKLNQ